MSTVADQPLDPNLPQNALLPPIKLAIEGMTGAFLVDPDRAENFITEVDGCVHMLDDAKQAARDAGDVKPPGGDPVTENAVIQANTMAENALQAITAYQERLRSTVAGLQADLAAYHTAEQNNTARQT
jgi:hypothetical protein